MDNMPVADNGRKRKKVALGIFFVVAAAGMVLLYIYLGYANTHISTDDAFISGSIHTVSSKVPGTITAVRAGDNQEVRKGDLLVELDSADYNALMQEAEAGLEAEYSKLAESEAGILVLKKRLEELGFGAGAARAALELKRALITQADTDLKRASNLADGEALSQARLENAQTAYDVALAGVKAAEEELKQADAAARTQEAAIKQKALALRAQEAAVKEKAAKLTTARLKRNYTRIYSPVDGYVTRKSAEPGNQVQAGQPLMAVVPLGDVWVIANYKETQLKRVRPGQKVRIEVDSYPGKELYGRVDSIMAGTGSVFSIFPPENATGNFVKVVQRIPVKITLDKDSDRDMVLRVGMSVVPTIIIDK